MMANRIYNTGETSEELKEEYNPEGSILRQVQLRLLDMLLYLDSVCKKLSVPYRIDGGNVLGAIRHNGFIPWDDDVDIVVEKKYYKKLCNYLKNNPHNQYVLQSPETDRGRLVFWNALRDTKSEYLHKNNNDWNDTFVYKGLQIDIFCYTSGIIPSLHKIGSIVHGKMISKIIGKSFFWAKALYSLEKYFLNPLFSAISHLFGNKNYYMHVYGVPFPYRFHKDVLFPYKDIEFEGHVFPGPANPEEFCKIIYKNYMDLPPKEKRNKHNVEYVIY